MKAEMTNVLSCQIVVGPISEIPQRSRQSETCRKFNIGHESLVLAPKYQKDLTNICLSRCEWALAAVHLL